VSALGHSVVVALLILIPLYYTHTIDLSQLQRTLLIAPPPPPPPPPPAVQVIRARAISFFHDNKLLAPKFIPKKIVQVKEQAPPPVQAFGGVSGGVAGGIPGSQLGGVLGGILGDMGKTVPPPPPPAKNASHVGPYHVGGQVQEPHLIKVVQPIYPQLAREAHMQGDVRIDSVIDEHGNVTQMKVVSGKPLLITAALDAVDQWKYQPTLLNGTPIAVEMTVTVHFTLASDSD